MIALSRADLSVENRHMRKKWQEAVMENGVLLDEIRQLKIENACLKHSLKIKDGEPA